AELFAGLRLDVVECLDRLLPHAVGEPLAGRVVGIAGFGRNRETGRHRQPGSGHLRHARPLAAQQVPQVLVALFEEVDPLLLGGRFRLCWGSGRDGHAESSLRCAGNPVRIPIGFTTSLYAISLPIAGRLVILWTALGMVEAPFRGEDGAMPESQPAVPRQYPPELRERAVRMVVEIIEQGDQVGAIPRVARQLGIRYVSLRRWVRQAEAEARHSGGVITAQQTRIAELERGNGEMRRAC